LAALLGTPIDDDGNELESGFAGNSGGGRQTPKPTQQTSPSKVDPAPVAKQPHTTEPFDPSLLVASPHQAVELNVYEIDNNPFQPRRDFNESEIASLAESLKEHQQLQPILVRRVGDRFQLISGERRLRAAIHAGLATVRAEIREADDRLVAELAIIENLQRKDLNAIEKAMSFKRYIEQHGCTQDELGKRLKIDRSTIANMMRLLELPEKILSWIQDDVLAAGHGRALLMLGDEGRQIKVGKQMIDEGWSVRASEQRLSDMLKSEEAEEQGLEGPAGKPGRKPISPHIDALQQELKHQLGTKVEIRQTSRGKGKITIHFTSAEEFERIQAVLSTQSSGQVPRLKVA
jgi:ParB family chromosome partitioning protein